MGKKRAVKKYGSTTDKGKRSRALSRIPKKKLSEGILFVDATFNNTKVSIADTKGNLIMWSSSGALGFQGTKKSTPYAAAKVGELLAEKAQAVGLQEVSVIIKGVGPGRESAMRSFATKGNFGIKKIEDRTPIPHNGPRAKKARRV